MAEAKRSSVAGGPVPAEDPEEQFTVFFRQHYRGAVGMIILLDGSREEAEDATQRAFEDAYRNWATIRSPSAWVRVAARNHFIKARTRDRNLQQRAIELHQMMRLDEETDQDLMAQWVDLNWIEQVLAELPPGQRQIVRCIFEGLSTKQIAELLGKNEPNVRSHLRHARNRLKDRLALIAPRRTPPTTTAAHPPAALWASPPQVSSSDHVLPEPGKEEAK
ncbi:RNA polymerase sigma factor [Actinomadura sp. 3N407]|uniref:RNA polymerase sigma factor n=1 Tax=Actinomadura sp. 3N407 TaxID=3457423 RepID=UPI003FCC385A